MQGFALKSRLPMTPDNITRFSPLYTDMYQLTMGQAYFMQSRSDFPAVFDYFFRKLPFDGGYVVFAGLRDLLLALKDLHFVDSDIDYLHKKGFNEDYLEYLKSFRFKGDIYGMQEGELVFPVEPVLRVEGGLLETQLVETLLLNLLNFQSLIATKASRIRKSAGNRMLTDFGLRRAQGTGGIQASRAAIIGGFDNTSNMLAASLHDLHPNGTMAHSFIESYDNELEAFRAYANTFPDHCVLLVDTYNTIKSGLPNAITVGRELLEKGHQLIGIRLDSGDLAYLSKKARKLLDEAGLDAVKIVVSNQLDEHVVKSLIEQGAPIDIFGVGTSMITGRPDGAIDGVYKLSSAGHKPRLKISENLQKTTLPGKKKVLRFLNDDGQYFGDCIAESGETNTELMIHPFEKEKSVSLKDMPHEDLFHCQMKKGEIITPPLTPFEIREIACNRLAKLPEEHKRFDFPHIYKVGVSQKLMNLQTEIIQKMQHSRKF
jgi:nicotinate phosphoribosyltransferase